MSGLIIESKFTFIHASLTSTLSCSYPIQCSLQIFDVTETESRLIFSENSFYLLSTVSTRMENAAKKETDRQPSTSVWYSRQVSSSPSLPSSEWYLEISQNGNASSASDTHRPCSLHDLTIAAKKQHRVISGIANTARCGDKRREEGKRYRVSLR